MTARTAQGAFGGPSVQINQVWGVAFRGGSFILLRNGREVASHKSAGTLWSTHRHRFGKVDPEAFNRLFSLGRENYHKCNCNSVLPSPEINLGYWLHPEQLDNLSRRKEGNHVD